MLFEGFQRKLTERAVTMSETRRGAWPQAGGPFI
jgi:hypothetical protein